MRTFHIVFMLVMLGFAAVQYNDPDGIYWSLVYLLSAFWSALAVWGPGELRSHSWTRLGSIATVALLLVGFAYLAPSITTDWIHIEEARESLGYLIAAVTTAIASWSMRSGGGATQRA